MERIICPVGTKQNFETVFSDLQDYNKTNLKRRSDQLVSSYGVNATVSNGVVTSTELKVQVGSSTTLTIEPGTALTPSFNFLRTLSQTTVNVSAIASGIYTVLANATPYSDTPVPIINGFLYDSGGSTTTNSRTHASVSFEVVDSGTLTTTSGIYLADFTWNGVDTAVVTDRRDENIFLIKDSAINDSNIVKKDRDSTITANTDFVGEVTIEMSDSADSFTLKYVGGLSLVSFLATKNSFLRNTGFGGQTDPEHEVDVTGTARATISVMTDLYTSDTEDDVLIQPKAIGGNVINKLFDDTGQGQFQDKDGVVVCYYDKDGFNFNKPATYNDLVTIANLAVTDGVTLPGFPTMSGVTNTTFKVGYGTLNGGAGLNVLTEDPDPTNVTNFRIYDNSPSNIEGSSEPSSFVQLKWNYDDVDGIWVSGNTFEVTGLLTAGGNIDNSSVNIVDKYLYFPNSGNRYQILTWDNTTKYMTLGSSYAGEEPASPAIPAIIIDGAATGYQIKITSNRDASSELGFSESDVKIINLDSDKITNPSVGFKLNLGEAHWIQIRAVNNLTTGSFILLPSGLYDPDHTPGGQAELSYAQPFVNSLPFLEDDGSITLDATLYGFNVIVGGWNGVDDKSAHEFEIGYTTLSTLDWNDSANTTRIRTPDSKHQVQTNTNSTWQVGVRPIQNRNVVGLPKVAQVQAGGGGVPPNMSLIAEATVDQVVISGMFTSINAASTVAATTYEFANITYYDDPFYGVTSLGQDSLVRGGRKLIPVGATWDAGSGGGAIIHNNSTESADPKFIKSVGLLSDDTLTNAVFYLGTSKATRRIYTSHLNSDMVIKKIVMDCDIAAGVSASNPGVIRVYQEGDEDNAGILDVPSINAVFEQALDVSILAATDATRNLIIDAWDPDTGTPNNTCQLAGTIRLYGENVVKTDDGER